MAQYVHGHFTSIFLIEKSIEISMKSREFNKENLPWFERPELSLLKPHLLTEISIKENRV